MIKSNDALTEIHFSQPGKMVMRINKETNLFLSRDYEHEPSLARWNRFYINTEPACLSGYFFHINTQLESNTSP